MTFIPGVDESTPTLAWPLIELAESALVVPTGLRAGGRLVLSAEQLQFLVAWYAVDERCRSFVYRRGVLRMAKGWAKSPLGAVVCLGELVGEVVPDGLNAAGEPVGRPHPSPWVQVAATSEDQTDNLYAQLFEMLRDSPVLGDLGLDVGLTRIMLRGRPGRIEPVTSSAGAREGQPVSAVVLEETHLWKRGNGGFALAGVLRRNATKMGARTLELTNAFSPGAGSVAEDSEVKVRKGRVAGALLVVREAPPVADLDDVVAVRAALVEAYGCSALDRGGWVDLDRVVADRHDFDEADFRRFFLNQVVAPEEAPVDLVVWAGLASADARLTAGDVVTLGFDGSDNRAATALYACRWPDWTVFELAVWHAPVDEHGHRVKGWRVNRAEVSAKVRWVFETFRVMRGYCDDAGWQSELDGWQSEWPQMVAFPHRIDARIGPACERFASMVGEGTLRHDGLPTLTQHIANARRSPVGREGSGWFRPLQRVEEQPIDALMAAVSAVHAMGDAVAHGETEQPVSVDPFVVFG